MTHYLCIHGHFYQPPRENPWSGEIETEASAAPYSNWNERISAECYAPNASAQILDSEGHILKTVNNYSKMSFNFGPTLLSWMQKKTPKIYQILLQADQESQKVFSGHGNALAQAYSHLILPLTNMRDKYTQIFWGKRDFEFRFGRSPEGMWLPETAVDLETLEILAELGIQFTLLAPHQAQHEVTTKTPHVLTLPSGKNISIFFYEASLSHAVAFENLLSNGDHFIQRLMEAFSEDTKREQLLHIATDGETYGHHHRFGEMALAYTIDFIESKKLARLTNYAEYLEKFPATLPVEIVENSSWSCSHGIARWQADCGCHSGTHPEWNQSWRTPLRAALDYLRDECIPLYEKEAGRFLRYPWAARNDSIDLILDPSEACWKKFINQHAKGTLSETEKNWVSKLLELQRCAMAMYTSCAWFFDDLAGLETIQTLKYAGKVLSLARELFEKDFEKSFLDLLAQGNSNLSEEGNGRQIYEKYVRPILPQAK